MQTRSQRLLLACLVLGGCSLAVTASAQVNPEEGGVWVPPPDDAPPPQQTQQQWYPQQQQYGQPQQQPPPPAQQPVAAQPPATAQPTDTRSDHARMVGHLAVGWMGVTDVPIGGRSGVEAVATPAVGVRYWISELVGIDVGLGLGFTGGTVEDGTTSAPIDNAFGMLIHGGVPLAIFHTQHYAFLIIPELNLGFSAGTLYGTLPELDQGRSGFVFSIGGRLGGEIHFGFMNIPNLSLQASVGLYFEYSQAGVSANRNGAGRAGVSGYSLGTTVLGEPWDIFLGSLQALYYF